MCRIKRDRKQLTVFAGMCSNGPAWCISTVESLKNENVCFLSIGLQDVQKAGFGIFIQYWDIGCYVTRNIGLESIVQVLR